MASRTETYVNPEEYLRREAVAEFRSEYYDGEIFPIHEARKPTWRTAPTIGMELAHAYVVSSVLARLYEASQRGPFRVVAVSSQLRVGLTPNGSRPDILGFSESPEFADADKEVVTNPTLIIEILSPRTEALTVARKVSNYDLMSLEEYVAITLATSQVEHYVKLEKNQWLLRTLTQNTQSLALQSLPCQVSLADIYEHVTWE